MKNIVLWTMTALAVIGFLYYPSNNHTNDGPQFHPQQKQANNGHLLEEPESLLGEGQGFNLFWQLLFYAYLLVWYLANSALGNNST